MISGQLLNEKELLKADNLLQNTDLNIESSSLKQYKIINGEAVNISVNTTSFDPLIITDDMVPFIFDVGYTYVKNTTSRKLIFTFTSNYSWYRVVNPGETTQISGYTGACLCMYLKEGVKNDPNVGDVVTLDGIECVVINKNSYSDSSTSYYLYICIDRNYDLDHYYPFEKDGITYGWNYGKVDKQTLSDSVHYTSFYKEIPSQEIELSRLIMERGCESLIPGEPTIWDALKSFRQTHSDLWFIGYNWYTTFPNEYVLNVSNTEYWSGLPQLSSSNSTYGDRVMAITPYYYNNTYYLWYTCHTDWVSDLITPRNVRLIRLATEKDFMTFS